MSPASPASACRWPPTRSASTAISPVRCYLRKTSTRSLPSGESRLPRPELFTPIELGGITLPNRIVVSPMCQYSADDGSMNDWHLVHLGHLAYSATGPLIVQSTQLTREGRITHGCTGLYSDHNEASMARVLAHCRTVSRNPIGI